MPIITRSRRYQDIESPESIAAEGIDASFDNTRRDLNQLDFSNKESLDILTSTEEIEKQEFKLKDWWIQRSTHHRLHRHQR